MAPGGQEELRAERAMRLEAEAREASFRNEFQVGYDSAAVAVDAGEPSESTTSEGLTVARQAGNDTPMATLSRYSITPSPTSETPSPSPSSSRLSLSLTPTLCQAFFPPSPLPLSFRCQ